MNFFQKTLNHFWHKPEHTSKPAQDGLPAAITSLAVLREHSYPCDKCNIESQHCFKLHFADRTICVIPKEYVNDFCSKNHPTPKDHLK